MLSRKPRVVTILSFFKKKKSLLSLLKGLKILAVEFRKVWVSILVHLSNRVYLY